MKVVILNSGMGTRMGALTKEYPKCMTEIDCNVTILSAQLNCVVASGIKDVVVTTGYYNDVLVEYCKSLNLPLNIEFAYNPLYSTTNYIYSMYCARDLLKGEDIILMHGDMVFEYDVFKKVAESTASCMAASTTMPLPPKDFKAVVDGDRISAIGIEFFENAIAAQPLYKFLESDFGAWLDRISEFVENERVTCYAENAFNEISDVICLRALDVKDALCNEVDNCDDLAVVSKRYKALFN